MVEAMLRFTTPGLLRYQLDSSTPLRLGNRHPALAPLGIYRCRESDQWIALAIDGGAAFASLGRIVGREDWIDGPVWASVDARKAREDEIDAAIAAWSMTQEPRAAAAVLREVRNHSGPQRQAWVSIRQSGKRLGARTPAPLLGEHSCEIAHHHSGVDHARYETLAREGIISFAPKPLSRAKPQ